MGVEFGLSELSKLHRAVRKRVVVGHRLCIFTNRKRVCLMFKTYDRIKTAVDRFKKSDFYAA